MPQPERTTSAARRYGRERFEATHDPQDFLRWLNAYVNETGREDHELHALCSHAHSVIAALQNEIAALLPHAQGAAMPGSEHPAASPSRADQLAALIGRPRRLLMCRTCRDFGMIEDFDGREDVCPTCEGGIWRDPESWRWYIHRQPWLGFRVLFFGRWLPTITLDRPV